MLKQPTIHLSYADRDSNLAVSNYLGHLSSWPERHSVPTLGFRRARPGASYSRILYLLNRTLLPEAYFCLPCQTSVAIVSY